MNIGVLLYGYLPSFHTGATLMTHELLLRLKNEGHNITVYTLNFQVPTIIDGITVLNYEKRKTVLPKFDLLITHPDVGKIAPDTALSQRIPLIGIVHNTSTETTKNLGKYFRVYNKLFFNSYATNEHYNEYSGFVLYSPLIANDYDIETGENITLVNVSQLKGAHLFYEIAAKMPNKKFLGVTNVWGTPIVKDLDNVKLVTYTTDIRSIYEETRMLLVPSRQESWGRVAAEAMAAGIPVLHSDLPGLNECVGAGGVALDNNVDSWISAIKKLSNIKHYNKVSSLAKERALEIQTTSELHISNFVSIINNFNTPVL